MRQSQSRIFESLRRVLDFLATHLEVLGSISTSEASKDVKEAVAEVSLHEVKQGSANRALVGQMSRQRVLAKQLIESHMQPIAKFARGKLRGVPGYADLKVSAYASQPRLLLSVARTMADTAVQYQDQFVSAGLAADTVDRLKAATEAFAGAMDQRTRAKGLRTVSTTAIEKALIRGRDAVLVLDAQIAQQLSIEHPVLAAWRTISRVEDKSGKTRTVVTAPAQSTEPVSAPVSSPII